MVKPRKRHRKLTPARRRARYAARKSLIAAAIVTVVAVFILADRAGLFGRAPTSDLNKYDGRTFRVVRVVDGDTIDIHQGDGKYPHTRIRLWGIDTPETLKRDTPVQHFGPEATGFTRAGVLDKTVRLQLQPHRTRDNHGRLLAYVVGPDGKMLNRLLVAGGYAYADPRYNHDLKAEFARLQRRAHKARRGLWAEVTRADLPYYYRDRLKLTDN